MSVLAIASLASLTWAQAPPPTAAAEPTWQNQGESDIGLAAKNETDLTKKLALLKTWEQQYPTSALSNQRVFMTTQTLTALIAAALSKPEGAALDAGVKAAQQLIRNIGDYFNDSLRSLPQLSQMSPADWAKIRSASEMQAHALLAYVAVSKKDDATAEAEYRRVLEIDPTQAGTSYQLGRLIIHEIATSNNFQRFPEALYELARSLSVTGPNALPPDGKNAAEKALKANYVNYHGGPDGIAELTQQTTKSALPPPDFRILSAQQIADAAQQEHAAWALQHPDLDLWQTIKATLDQPGDEYFTEKLKGVGLPPPAGAGYKGSDMFSGKVVAVLSPKQILVNVDSTAGDAILKLDQNIKGDIPAGTAIRFKGMVDSYTKSPSYTLTLEILEPKTDIADLPEGVTFAPDKAASRAPKLSH